MTSRRLTRFGVPLAIALALLLTVTAPAAGEPDCNKVPDNPHCQDPGPLPDHPDGGTCEASGDPWIAATDGFTATLTDSSEYRITED